jgi:hypothetical protein
MTDMPSFLTPQSNGAENLRHDRLSYRVQPNPRFELKAGDSDVSEPIEISELAMDLSNMNIGYVKWVGTTPSKILNNALDSMPPKPVGDGWSKIYELVVYSAKNLDKKIFFDVTNWGGQRGVESAFRDFLNDCKSKNIDLRSSKNYLPIFLYTGTLAIKNKEGKVTTQEPIFKLQRVIQNPTTNGSGNVTVVEEISDIAKHIEKSDNSSIDALKSVKQL